MTQLFFISFGPLSPWIRISAFRRSCPRSRNLSKVLANKSTVLLLSDATPDNESPRNMSWPWAMTAVAVSLGAMKRLYSLACKAWSFGHVNFAQSIESQIKTTVSGALKPARLLATFRECQYVTLSRYCFSR